MNRSRSILGVACALAVAWPLGAQERPTLDSARATAFFDALGAADPVICELVSDQLGNFWWSDSELGIGRLGDALVSARTAKSAFARRISDPGAIRVLGARLAAENPCVRLTAAKLLGETTISDDALGRYLEAPSARVREAALRAVGGGERAALRGQVERMLGAREVPVAAMAAWALGEIEHRASVPALRRALTHDAATVRLTAAWALGSIEDPVAVPDLEARASSDSDRRVKLAAIHALGDIGSARALDGLVRLVDGRDLEVSVAAAEAIASIGDLEAAPPALIRAAESSHVPLRHAALSVLVEIEDPALAPVLLAHVTDADPDVRAAVIEALGELKARVAIPAIRRALTDPVADVRRAALEALAEINER